MSTAQAQMGVKRKRGTAGNTLGTVGGVLAGIAALVAFLAITANSTAETVYQQQYYAIATAGASVVLALGLLGIGLGYALNVIHACLLNGDASRAP